MMRPKTGEDPLAGLKGLGITPPSVMAMSVGLQAEALAEATRAIEGGEWRVRVDHQRETILIRRC